LGGHAFTGAPCLPRQHRWLRDAAAALQGHDVRAAYSGAEALRLAEHFKPQLDIGMPKMNARCAEQPC